jgi:hypothetical protein
MWCLHSPQCKQTGRLFINIYGRALRSLYTLAYNIKVHGGARRSKKGTDRRRALFSAQQNLILYRASENESAASAQCWPLCVYIYMRATPDDSVAISSPSALYCPLCIVYVCMRAYIREINFMGVSLCVQRAKCRNVCGILCIMGGLI